ncbi:MAG TPA: adenylyltransferase/cytidyltransferase family protein [Acidimicrobiales bacterium]|nr:adenylyltransferase/cytidyltransferase family protein [Acidimicrobiales bacterium]
MADASGCVVTVGTYDGVHLGHRRLLAEAMEEGRRRSLPTVVVTFDRHPTEVLRPDRAPRLLTGLDHKLELLAATGVDEVEVLHFDLERAHESAEDFVLGDLVGRLGARAVLVGTNFRFGHRQRGDVALLEELASRHDFAARGIELYIDDETRTVVSSSVIRAHLAAGAVGEAARLLGRPHEVRGHLAAGRLALDGPLALPGSGRFPVLVGPPGGDAEPALATVTAPEELFLLSPAGGPLALSGRLAVRFTGRREDEPATGAAHAAAGAS